jgi:hypothetical protein
MAKAIVLLGLNGLALAPARACAETAEEALHLGLPMLDAVLGQMCAGKDVRSDGETRYRLVHEGRFAGTIEVLDIPQPGQAEKKPPADTDPSQSSG